MSSFISHVVFWAAVVACAVAQGAIVRSVLRAPAGRQPREVAWALAPAFALAAVLLFTWRVLPA